MKAVTWSLDDLGEKLVHGNWVPVMASTLALSDPVAVWPWAEVKMTGDDPRIELGGKPEGKPVAIAPVSKLVACEHVD